MQHLPKLFLLLLLLLPACSQPITEAVQPEILFGTRANPVLAAELSQLTYPKDAPGGAELDVLAIKSGKRIAFMNRTTTAYKDVQVWINQQYVAKVEAIDVGENRSISLDRFINQYGEAFPIGGLLNPDKSYPVVLAELFEPNVDPSNTMTGKRHKFIVRTED